MAMSECLVVRQHRNSPEQTDLIGALITDLSKGDQTGPVTCRHNKTAGLLVINQYSEGPATDHLDTGFSWFPCVYKQMLRWFPRFQVATTCF